MTTQTPRTVSVVQEFGDKADVTVPPKEMVIQTIYKKVIGDTIIPSEVPLKAQIKTIHDKGEDAFIIVCAPIVDRQQSRSLFDMPSNPYQYHVATYADLQKAGLADFAQVRKDANAVRGGYSAAAQKAARERTFAVAS
jgi:hypothetical protein